MVSASETADRLEEHRRFVAAAAEAGVRHIVYTSFAGAAAVCIFTLGGVTTGRPRRRSERP